jgi:hypothetical protein
MNRRSIVDAFSSSKLANISQDLLTDLPLISLDIDKVYLSTGISHIAPYSNWVKQTFVNFNIFEGDIPQGYSWLGLACPFFVEGIEHTSRSISVGLLHLLGPNVDCPPNWSVHSEVFIVNVGNVPITLVPWVCFHIDSLQRSFLDNISKRDVPYTIPSDFWWYTSNSQADTKYNLYVLNKHIPGTVNIMTGLWHYNIIPILDSHIVNVHPSSRRVNAISVEREHDDQTLQ